VTTTENPRDDATDAPANPDAAAEPFEFHAEVVIPTNGQPYALVRYDGDGNTLKSAARQIGVEVDEGSPDGAGNRRVKISGGNLQTALQEYASRANRAGSYTLGDLGVFAW
jgi:hypothetical protein